MNLKDLAERFVWTVVAAALTNLVGVGVLDLTAWQAAALAGMNGGVTYLLVVARWRLSVLPDPGAGLPGLPTDDGGQSVALIAGIAAVVCLVLLFAFDLI